MTQLNGSKRSYAGADARVAALFREARAVRPAGPVEGMLLFGILIVGFLVGLLTGRYVNKG